MTFSANLGFLWTDRSLPDAVRAAGLAGFHAVEFHWPYETDPGAVKAALDETGLPALGLNTVRGDLDRGENGLSAVPGRETAARTAIDQALAYAVAIGARNVHVMAGLAAGGEANAAFLANLRYACSKAEADGIGILIEPLNRHDAPGYFLQTTDQARDIIGLVDHPLLRLMFDCYHVGRTEGDIITRARDLMPLIGHVQFASVPDRGPPDAGEIDYAAVFRAFRDMGWDAPLGAEYLPEGDTAATLGWMKRFGALSVR